MFSSLSIILSPWDDRGAQPEKMPLYSFSQQSKGFKPQRTAMKYPECDHSNHSRRMEKDMYNLFSLHTCDLGKRRP